MKTSMIVAAFGIDEEDNVVVYKKRLNWICIVLIILWIMEKILSKEKQDIEIWYFYMVIHRY